MATQCALLPPGPYERAPASAEASAYACRFRRSDIASPVSKTITPSTVREMIMATMMTTA